MRAMMHIAYPNVVKDDHDRNNRVYGGCVRYLSVLPSQTPVPPYEEAKARTHDAHKGVLAAVDYLVPERINLVTGGIILKQVYQKADRKGIGTGSSLDLALLLAEVRCYRPFKLEALAYLGDVWCTGTIPPWTTMPTLYPPNDQTFLAKLYGFFEQADDRLFFVPSPSIKSSAARECRKHRVDILTLAEFRQILADALETGRRLGSAVIAVLPNELQELRDALFESSPPYKFLDAFGPNDATVFCGRDQDIDQLRQMLTDSRLLILYGASGTGKTSLLQAGLLPNLPPDGYASVYVRMVDDEPTAAIKAALVRECEIDVQFIEQSLIEVIRKVTEDPRRTVVLILDQFEEFF
jgi:hypothetical protein